MILVTGAGGQLASALSEKINSTDVVFKDESELDITDAKSIKSFVNNEKIKVIINCAAFTDVEGAEENTSTAYAVNSEGVLNLTTVCEEHDVFLIHISTDYVFDGKSITPYSEDESTNPLSVYGLSKLKGETHILNSNLNSVIIRTSWIFSEYGKNFVKTMRTLLMERDAVSVVGDQIGCPTYAGDLALFIATHLEEICKIKGTEIFHYTSGAACSWFEFASEIKSLLGSQCKINEVTSSEYPQKAKRPMYSVLNTEKIKNKFDIDVPDWKRSLALCLKKMS